MRSGIRAACQPVTATPLSALLPVLQARGVFDPNRRQQLVNVAQQLVSNSTDESVLGVAGGVAGPSTSGDGILPGIPSTWDMHSSSPEVMTRAHAM